MPVNVSNSHQAVRSMSCMRRAPTAMPGSVIARLKMLLIGDTPLVPKPRTPSTIKATKLPSVANRTQYQYSEREALPENVTYFEKQLLTACWNVMFAHPFSPPRLGRRGRFIGSSQFPF